MLIKVSRQSRLGGCQTTINMASTITSLLLLVFLAAPFSASLDLDPADDLKEEEFAEYFHHSDSDLSDGQLEREEALVENEKIIRETNSEFLAGRILCWDKRQS